MFMLVYLMQYRMQSMVKSVIRKKKNYINSCINNNTNFEHSHRQSQAVQVELN